MLLYFPAEQPMDAAAARGTSRRMERPIIAAAAMRSSLSPLLPGLPRSQLPMPSLLLPGVEEQRRKDSMPFVVGKPFETVDSAAVWRGSRFRLRADRLAGGLDAGHLWTARDKRPIKGRRPERGR